MEVEKRYAFGQRSPEIDPNPPILDAPQYPSSHNYSFENPQPRTFIAAETAPAAEPGFYIVPQSVSTYDFYHGLFDNMPDSALTKFSALNPNLEDIVKAGTLIVLSDPNNTSCTYAESQLMEAAHQVKAALAPLTPDEADFMHRHAAEIVSFTGQSSTWLGVSAAVMEKHLVEISKTLKGIEELHQNSFRKQGNLSSPEFFAQRKILISQLNAQFLKSTRLRSFTTLSDHHNLKKALGISTQSLVHHWKQAGGPKSIHGYSTHVESVSKAAKYMKAGGYIGIGIGGVSSVLAIQEVCGHRDAEACRKIKFTEGGKFAGSTAGGFAGGELAARTAGPICALLGAAGGVPGVICIGIFIGAGAWLGSTGVGIGGEMMGEAIYEVLPL
ncbi:hypothetical protein [Pseudomonas maioricensis]|nr:hypothetical protein [Pseudomonas sp. S25]